MEIVSKRQVVMSFCDEYVLSIHGCGDPDVMIMKWDRDNVIMD